MSLVRHSETLALTNLRAIDEDRRVRSISPGTRVA